MKLNILIYQLFKNIILIIVLKKIIALINLKLEKLLKTKLCKLK